MLAFLPPSARVAMVVASCGIGLTSQGTTVLNGQGTHAERIVVEPSGRCWSLEGGSGPEDCERVATGVLSVMLCGNVRVEDVAQRYGLEVQGAPVYAPKTILLRCRPEHTWIKLAALRDDGCVASAEAVLGRNRQPAGIPGDFFFNRSWHLLNQLALPSGNPRYDLRVTSAWGNFTTTGMLGRGIRVGVMDDGIESGHPDLTVDASAGRSWFRTAAGNQIATNGEPGSISDDHGTPVSGLIAARVNNAPGDGSVGAVGIAPAATLVSLRFLGGWREGAAFLHPDDSQEAEMMTHLCRGSDAAVQIKNGSFANPASLDEITGPGPLGAAAFRWGTQWGRDGKGTIYVMAVGNGGTAKDANLNPYASSTHVIAVGGVDELGKPTYFSQPGACLHVCTPADRSEGTNLFADRLITTDLTSWPGYNGNDSGASLGNIYTLFNGTSAAAPQVSGACALLLEANPRLGWRDVQEILLRSAQKVWPQDVGWITNAAGLHFHRGYGAGMLDVTAAVQLAQTWQPLRRWKKRSVSLATLPMPIPDAPNPGLIVPLTISGGPFRVERVALTASITHPRRGHLSMKLRSPAGTETMLVPSYTSTQANYTDYTFTSNVTWGEDGEDTWEATIKDEVTGEVGAIQALRLDLFGTSEVPDPYDTWLVQAFGSNTVANQALESTQWGDQADADHDGLPTLAEAALGLSPQHADSWPLTVKLTSQGPQLSWYSGSLASQIDALPEWSADLETWHVSNEWVNGVRRQFAESASTTGETIYTLSPSNDLPRLYLRLSFAHRHP